MGSSILSFKAHASQIDGTVKPSLVPCRVRTLRACGVAVAPFFWHRPLMRRDVVSPGFSSLPMRRIRFFHFRSRMVMLRHASQSLGAC